ncbi:patatin-like phospholipase family protein [Maritalea mobilis]|uniref:patatin-like phospholipase family protein n=1 Tax=Maritalea mobilis TaxID=483324 RepID=UPI001C977FA1|nr:patatin-like phospholipase family protein [Maritalea mobilis]MBY6203174.1 patatin-like phospholipase family protein [Maritalea mobilis]
MDKALVARVTPKDGKRVTFRDIWDERAVDLKVVATELRTGRMVLFDAYDTPDTCVSDAVMASAAIPILFKPVLIDGKEYCDGGLVSNLPAWTFDRNRLLDESCLTISSILSDAPPMDDEALRSIAPLRGASLYERVASSALSGASDLNTRGLLNHLRLPLEPGFGLLDFERTSKHLQAVQDATDVSASRLELLRYEMDSLDEIHGQISEYLKQIGVDPESLRTALVRDVRLSGRKPAAYRPWRCRGYENYQDDLLLLPAKDSLVSTAVETKRLIYKDITTDAGAADYYNLGTETRYAKLLPRDRCWIVVIPVNHDGTSGCRSESGIELTRAITIDGSHALPNNLVQHASKMRDLVDEFSVYTPYVND